MKPVIRVEGLSKRFGREVALDDVSFEVPSGVVFALLGENGAGKSTAIRILLGLVEPDGGSADVLEHDSLCDGVEIRRRVGYVAERPTLYEWMTVDEIGWFAAGFYENGYLEQYHRLVVQYRLPRKRKIRDLSKGMRAEVSLSLALALDPDLLVLDEPTSGLDTMVRRKFLESMVERAAEGKTVLLASHQIHEVERVADYVAIIHQGRLLLAESLEQLKQEVREVTVVLDDHASPRLLDGVIDCELRGRQFRMTARCPESVLATELSAHYGAQDPQVRIPTLEEIFVSYMAGRVSA